MEFFFEENILILGVDQVLSGKIRLKTARSASTIQNLLSTENSFFLPCVYDRMYAHILICFIEGNPILCTNYLCCLLLPVNHKTCQKQETTLQPSFFSLKKEENKQNFFLLTGTN